MNVLRALGNNGNSEAKYVQATPAKNQIKNRSTFISSDLLLFYLLWPIIILPKELQFVLLSLIALLLLKKHKLYFDLLGYFLYSYILLYAFSILLNVLTRSSEYIRVLAAFNSLSIWILALIFYLIYKKIDIDMKKFIEIGFVNYFLLILVWAISIPIHSLTSFDEINIMTRTLYYNETFNQEVVTRFVGLMDYSNLIVMFCIFFYPLYFMHILSFKSKILQITLLIIGVLPIVSSYSRSGYLIIGTAIIIGIVYYFYKSINNSVFFFFFFLFSSILLTFIFVTEFHNILALEVKELFDAREGSNNSRQQIVAESINTAVRDSPIVGMGIKDNSSNGYPLGSHSTFIGFFYKTGIIGFILGTWIFIFINLKILLVKGNLDRKIISIFIFLMPLVFIVEDIDGANWLICIYFVYIALLLNDNNWRTKIR